MGIEFELKYRATEAQLAAIRENIPGQEQQFSMETTYYDTPSGSLSARHYTLRIRKENHISVCTLKTPAPGGARQELEVECDDILKALPEFCRRSEVQELPILLQEGLVAVCGAKFTRIAKTVVTESCTLELALDQGILLGGGRQLPLCEFEAELKYGTPEAAAACAEEIAKTYGLEPESRSKFHRARLLAEGKL